MERRRRPCRAKLVERLEGSTKAKTRLRLILETLAGERTVSAAGQALGVSRRRFHDLRAEFLRVALDLLEPRPAGRPGRQQGEEEHLAELKAEIQRLTIDLHAAQVREEIALAMPHLLRRTKAGKKARAKGRRARSSHVEKPAM
jgi:hypothetical protein